MQFKKLGNIADIIAGQSPPSSTYNSEGNGIPFFQGKADYGEKYPTVRYWCTEPTKISQPDDILISMRAPVGPVNINTVESCIGRGLSAIRVKKNVSRDFIYFWLKQNQHIIAAKQTGSTFKAITQKILNEIVVPFPSYPDQLHIANLLSKAENLITQRKESIRLLDEFLKSTFLEMFGDPVRNEKGWESDILDNGCRRINVGFVGTCEKYYTDNSGIPLIRTGNLTDTFVDWKNLKYVTEEFHSANKKSQVSEGDILIARHGDNGKATLYKGEKGTVNTLNIVVASPNISIYNGYFLIYLLNNNSVRNLISSKTGGSTQKVVNTKTLQKLSLIVPPIELQTQFAQIVEKTDALKTQYQQSLQELENLYGSLSQRAFRGELEMKRKTEPH